MFQKIRSVFLALAVAVLPANARSRATASDNAVEGRTINFRELVSGAGGLRFTASSASRSVVFRCEPNGLPSAGSALHLFIQHGPEIDGSRSFLSVTLNYGILRSIRLDLESAGGSELVIPLPPAQLKQENELAFSVEQYPRPGAPQTAIWTSISADSFVALEYEWRPAPLDLASLPAPLLEPRGARGRTLDILVPQRVSTPTLEAAALLLASFAARLAPEPLYPRIIYSTRNAGRPTVIVGTPAEQPELRSPQFREVAVGAGSEGIAALTGGSFRTLVVTGAQPKAVLRAAKCLASADCDVSGKLATFATEPRTPSPPRRSWKGFIPPSDRFRLSDLQRDEVKLGAAQGYSASLPLNATPDAVFLDYGAEASLALRFEPHAYELNPELAIELNGTELRRSRLQEISKKPQFSIDLRIPGRLLRNSNLLRVSLTGALESTGLQAAGAVLPDSQFFLPRDYRAALPDLALLRRHFYPFSLRADLSDTTVLVPDHMSPGTYAALMQFAAGAGRLLPGTNSAFHVRRYRDFSAAEIGDSHVIFLGVGAPPDRVFQNWPRTPVLRALPAVQETLSPWNGSKCFLSITAASPESLEQTVARLFSDSTLAGLSGDAVQFTAAGPLCSVLARKQFIKESSFLTHVQARLRANWIALPGVLFVVSGILFVGVRLALAHYRNGSR